MLPKNVTSTMVDVCGRLDNTVERIVISEPDELTCLEKEEDRSRQVKAKGLLAAPSLDSLPSLYQHQSLLSIPSTPGLLQGPRRVLRLCLFAVVLPAVLITIPLYVRLVLYPPSHYPMMPTDQRLLNKHVSSIWCQAQSTHMNGSYNAYLSTGAPGVSKARRTHVMLNHLELHDDIKEYWGFYFLKGTTITLASCAKWDGGQLMILRGVENLRRCAWLGEMDSAEDMEEDDDPLSLEDKASGLILEQQDMEDDLETRVDSMALGGVRRGKNGIEEQERDLQKGKRQEELVVVRGNLLSTAGGTMVDASMLNNVTQDSTAGEAAVGGNDTAGEAAGGGNDTAGEAAGGGNDTAGETAGGGNDTAGETADVDKIAKAVEGKDEEDRSQERRQDLTQLLRKAMKMSKGKKEILSILHRENQASDNTSEKDETLREMTRRLKEGIQNERRKRKRNRKKKGRREQNLTEEDLTADARHTRLRRSLQEQDLDAALEEDVEEVLPILVEPMLPKNPQEPERPNASPVDTALGGHVRFSQGVKFERGVLNQTTPGDGSREEHRSSYSSSEEALASCEGVILTLPLVSLRSCSYNQLTLNKISYDIPVDGTYYFVFSSDNEIYVNDLYFNLTMQRAVYEVGDGHQRCHNATTCSLPLHFWGDEQTVVEVPEGTDWDEAFVLDTKCEPRVYLYLALILLVPLLIMCCAFQ